MGTQAKKRYIRLGEQAKEGNFYCALLGVSIIPNKIVELPKNFRTSKRLVRALNNGHLEYVDSEEVAEYLKKHGVSGDGNSGDEVNFDNMTKQKLVDFILENDSEVSELDKSDYSKDELIDMATGLVD